MSFINPVKRGYLALETWFNISFGHQWNPLYNLGTLTFFFFWIILVSGLYLFIFFDSTLMGAYSSVEYMTNEQWYAAGVMRSLHRYASDAAIITILLHMFREFALDRYRGFRWFSWVTGVPTLWLVVTLGITGYWLVWDELALYVAILSSQLMDGLPLLPGTMSRNFLAEQINDRFFTLMAFLHLLGQPVILVFALWFHVKRLSGVSIMAPRGLAIGTFTALVILSLIAPAVSHDPADVTQTPAILNIDWFYLNIYPLLDYWTAGQVWMLTIGITVFLMLMPWLPKKKQDEVARVFLDHCNGCEQCAKDCPFDAITVQKRTDGARWENEVVVHDNLCASCGICVGSCPSSNPFRHSEKSLITGIDMPNSPINDVRDQVDAEIERVNKSSSDSDIKIIVFGCDNALDFKGLESSNTGIIKYYCVGMIPPTMVEYALKKGADGVFITGCRTGDCYFRHGNQWMDERFDGDRKPILRKRAERARINVFRAVETECKELRAELDRFQQKLSSMHKETESVDSDLVESDIVERKNGEV
ncbi:MAG: hydrogenase iron-sulfur subunit [Gammaproteobacteria bacterium]|jgi:coenzyme F420-reducing hydrogenase delta subunit/quinol-cytochrome oxidoreductase complex cytochrome b subunit|nr:hydrogenase iron-sulfur subunit [Gammaproteobacteria bacterium]MBT3725310.1 hydrogenase iron-sulfur subunit [Gammaproteobacteria bacterium]MBT4075026.1 hydrogenase iron-sulfur subunit [Gammaproteobacteria bacterium]MBT4195356.1 hydrogenase iron-sulfur subunit [Gammaproteobacteria bacterium]MBT4449659.1 hydrogenase iron-sulfur subunit [Gammaproteobacteria bacterium]